MYSKIKQPPTHLPPNWLLRCSTLPAIPRTLADMSQTCPESGAFSKTSSCRLDCITAASAADNFCDTGCSNGFSDGTPLPLATGDSISTGLMGGVAIETSTGDAFVSPLPALSSM